MKTIGFIISSFFKDIGIEEKMKLCEIQDKWHNLFNEPLSLHTYPVQLKDGELLLNVDSPAWLGQLRFFRNEIIKRLSTYNINSVRFKHGSVYYKEKQISKGKSGGNINQYSCISNSDIKWIDEIISTISDSELKKNIKNAIEKSLIKRVD